MSVITMSIDDNTINNINTSAISNTTNNISLNSLNLYDSTVLKNKMENRINIPVISKEQLQQQIELQKLQTQIIHTNQPITLSQNISLTQPSQPQIIKVIHVAQPAQTAPTQNVFIAGNPTISQSNIPNSQTLNISMTDNTKRRHSIPNIMEQDQEPSPNQPGPRRRSIQLNEIPLPTNPDAMAIDPKPVTQPTTVNITNTSPANSQPTIIAAAPAVAAPQQIRYIYGIPRAPSLPINNIVPVTMSPIQPLKTFPALPLSNFVVYLVNRIWYHQKPDCRNIAQPKYVELTKFVEEVLKITDLSLNTVLLALRYIYMLRQKCLSDQQILEWSMKDLISVHFMLANKFLSDDRYSNSVWASVCSKDLDEMNRLEKKSLEILQFNLNVHEDEFKSWEKSITNLGKELRQRMTTLQHERNLKKQQAELTALLNETMSNTNVIQKPLFNQTTPFSTLVVNNVPAIPINPGTATINIINTHPAATAAITQNPTTIITTNTQVAPTLATASLNLKFAPQPTNVAGVTNVARVVSAANPAQITSVGNVTSVAAIAQQNSIPINTVAVKRVIPTSPPKVSVTPMYVCNNKLVTSLPATATATGLTVVNPAVNTVGTFNANSIYPSPPLCRISNSQPTTTVLATPNFIGPATVTLVSTNGEVSNLNATRGINTLTSESSSNATIFTPQTVRTTTLVPANVNLSTNVTPTSQTGISTTSNNCQFLKHSLSSTSLSNLQQQQQQQQQSQYKANYNSPLSQHHLSSGSRLKTSNSAINLSSFKNNNVFKYQPQSIINHTATLNNLNELNLPINRIPTPINYSSPKKMRFSSGVTTSAPSAYIKKENVVGVPLLTTSPLNGIAQVQLPNVNGTGITQNNTIFKTTNTSDPSINLIPTHKPMFY